MPGVVEKLYSNHPVNEIDEAIDRSAQELKVLATIYQKRGRPSLAEEIFRLIATMLAREKGSPENAGGQSRSANVSAPSDFG